MRVRMKVTIAKATVTKRNLKQKTRTARRKTGLGTEMRRIQVGMWMRVASKIQQLSKRNE